jgi:hypothetical protein
MNFARWGISLAEMRTERWPRAQEDSPVPDETWYRAVSVNAPAEIVFRRICQLRAALRKQLLTLKSLSESFYH